jgi:amino acid adenylation domain-containing protein
VGAAAPFSLLGAEDRTRMPSDVDDAYPLTSLQASLVFESQHGSGYVNYVYSIGVRQRFDVGAFRRTLDELASRHPILRTSFDLAGPGEPLQLVRRTPSPAIRVVDARGQASTDQAEGIRRLIEAEKRAPIDWSACPPLRWHVYWLDADAFEVILTESLLDGWSAASLVREFLGRYEALLAGVPLAVSRLETGFGDYVALERRALGSDETRRFWDRQLSGYAAHAFERGADGSRGAGTRRVVVSLAPRLGEDLRRLAVAAGAPLKSVLIAAHMRVLRTLTGQLDVATGLITNGRPEAPDGDKILGMFLNTVPFRMRLSGGTWIDLVRQARDVEREVWPHRHYPFAALQARWGAQPMLQTALNYTHFHVYRDLRDPGDILGSGLAFADQTYFPLTAQFNVDHATGQVRLGLDYAADALDEGQVEEMGGWYAQVLGAMAQDPAGSCRDSSPLSARTRDRLVGEWNDTGGSYAHDRCIHELFEEQAGRAPGAAAVLGEEEVLTFAELERRANGIARLLRDGGAGPETLVGVCMRRSPRLVASLLGVLKAGAAYVPLDPEHPRERLRFLLDDTRAPLVLADAGLADALTGPGRRVVVLDGHDGHGVFAADERVASRVRPDHPAYVVYTSGSTGVPKGVLGVHRGAVNRFEWMWRRYPFEPGEVCCQKTSLGFLDSLWEIFGTLLQGVPIVIVPDAALLDVPRLVALLARHRVSRIVLVPSLLRALLETDADLARELPALKYWVTSGEALPADLARRFREALPNARLLNLYGSSEISADSTAHEVTDVAGASVPIGRPIANTQVYVLDEAQQLVPPGVRGEIYVGGVGLARGYLGRPDLTAERFVPDPFGGERGARLYRTGDVGRHRPDGTLEYCGRSDQQVKVRGMRVELGEIEAALARHASVAQAVVLARQSGERAERELVAFVVARQAIEMQELQAFLRGVLPGHMVPRLFVPLRTLPLTATGKVDRQALLRSDAPAAVPQRTVVAPRTEVERALARVWTGILGVEDVGATDDFMDLGGHSLAAMRLLSRIREVFEVDIPMARLLSDPTLEMMAAAIEKAFVDGLAADADGRRAASTVEEAV